MQLADLKASSRAAALQAMQKAALGDQAQGQGLQLHGPSIAGKSLVNVLSHVYTAGCKCQVPCRSTSWKPSSDIRTLHEHWRSS